VKRGEGPKADPEKVRAWQQRSRDRAAERAREHRRNMGAGVRRQQERFAGRDLRTDAERLGPPGEKRVVFKARTAARKHRCFRCGRRAQQWHHWLPQQAIRVYVRGLRLASEDARPLLRRLLRDERNLSAVCAGCHAEHESPGVDSRRFAAEDVVSTAHEFAAELGPEWASRLVTMYPAAGRSRTRPDGG
jgi:hypothetical protein